jgi:hypothetical protein
MAACPSTPCIYKVHTIRSRKFDASALPERALDDPQIRKIVDQGLKAFYSDATIDAKMDALPFLEALEQTVKWSH